MKVTMLALAFAACAATASAYAANSAPHSADASAGNDDTQHALQWTPDQNATHAKTRAEVRQELVRAQKDGQLAALNRLYQGS